MKIAEYKGYEIEFYESGGQFSIKGISGLFEKYKDATTKIDRVVRAETKENFPVDVVSKDLKLGKITSYNKLERDAWFTTQGGRSKERLLDYSGKPKFYKANESNVKLTQKYAELSQTINRLGDERRALEGELTEPIVFDINEDLA